MKQLAKLLKLSTVIRLNRNQHITYKPWGLLFFVQFS